MSLGGRHCEQAHKPGPGFVWGWRGLLATLGAGSTPCRVLGTSSLVEGQQALSGWPIHLQASPHPTPSAQHREWRVSVPPPWGTPAQAQSLVCPPPPQLLVPGSWLSGSS